VNYDIPYDTEAYVHRIGRTGRAGRMGDAILFVAPREQRMLRAIEHATRQPITQMQLPSTDVINDKRIARFHQKITDTLAAGELSLYQELIERYQQAQNVPALEIAAALAKLAQGSTPLLLKPQPDAPVRDEPPHRSRNQGSGEYDRPRRPNPRARRDEGASEEGMETFRLEVGLAHNVKPGNIVGAIANEAGIEGRHIGRIRLYEEYSTVDLPEGMPADIFNGLKKTRVAGRPLNISRVTDARPVEGSEKPAVHAPRTHKPAAHPNKAAHHSKPRSKDKKKRRKS